MRFLALFYSFFFLTLVSCGGKDGAVQRSSRFAGQISVLQEIPGILPYTDTVDRLGNLNITIAIDTLPVGNQLGPKLSLYYSSSNSSESLLGRGWGLGGLWSIRRCAATKAIDGFVHAPDLGKSDRFCLNSDRLIVVKGLYGENGSEYRTAIDSHMQIVLSKNSVTDPGNFVIKNRAGETLSFGSAGISRDESLDGGNAYAWHIDRLSDVNGNFISYSYVKGDGGVALIKNISYGGNSINAVPHYRTLTMNYIDGPKRSIGAYGRFFAENRTLSSIDIFTENKLVWSYGISYSTDRHQSVLKGIRKCFSDGACYKETLFDYESTATKISETSALTSPSFGNQTPNFFSGQNSYRTVTDVNRDGFNDLLAINATGILVGQGSKDGFAPMTKIGTDPVLSKINIKIDTVEINDVNRDSYPDIVILQTTGASPGTWVALGGPSGFSGFSSWLSFPSGFWKAQVHFRTLADVDLDGYPDLVGYNDKGVFIYKNLGDRFQASDTPALGEFGALQRWSFVDHPRYVFDINGDGFPDIVGFHETEVRVALGNGTTFDPPRVWSREFGKDRYSSESPRYLIDINGDGLPDVVGFAIDGVRVGLNNGREFASSELWIPDLGYNQGWTSKTQIRLCYDINGDGIEDFIGITPTKAKIYLGRNRQLSAAEQAGSQELPLNRLRTWNRQLDPNFFAQLNGSQTAGLGILMQGGIWSLKAEDNFGRLNFAKDGFGNELSVSYVGFSDTSTYAQDMAFSYPKISIQSGLSLVKKIDRRSPGQGSRNISYSYKNASYNRDGFGLVGFSEINEFDSGTNQLVTKIFSQSLQGNIQDGRPVKETTFLLKNGIYKQLTSSINEWAIRQPYGTSYPNQIFQKSNTLEQYSLEQGLISTSTTTQDFDKVGNLLSQEITLKYQSQEIKKLIENRFDYENEKDWIIGRISRATVTHSRTGQTMIKKVSEFHYDSAGNLQSQRQEPDTSFEIKKAFSRLNNKFGLVDTTTTTWASEQGKGFDFTQTVESMNFDGRGFPINSTNSLNQTTTHVIDPVFGIEIGTTDPNNISTSTKLDTHGDLDYSISFDGIKTSASRSFCDTSCPNTAVYSVTVSAPGRGEKISYFDSKGRVIRETSKDWNAKTINIDKSYNPLGQVVSETRPYFVGDSAYSTAYFYDELQRPWKTIQPDLSEVTISYSGFQESLKNADGFTTHRVTNPQGEVVAVIDALQNRTSYDYYADGKLKGIIDWKNNSSVYEYDALGRQISSKTPDSGVMVTKYNALGLPYEIIDAKNESVTMNYDSLGRIKNKKYLTGAVETWKYDEKVIGLLDEVSKKDFKEVYFYDKIGRTQSIDTTIKGRHYKVSKVYDDLGRLLTLTYPTGRVIQYSYADNGTMVAITSPDKSKTFWKLTSSDAASRVTSETFGTQISQSWNWNAKTGFLDSVVSTNGAAVVVQSNHYTYKTSGIPTLDEDGITGITERYKHDDLGRLYEVSRGQKNIGLTFNELGDIKTKSDVGTYDYGISCQGAFKPGPHAPAVINGNPRCYNAKGQMTTGDGKNISYTFSGQPERVSAEGAIGEFLYDNNLQKIYQKNQSNNRMVEKYFVGGGLFEESIESGGAAQKIYIGSGVVIVTKNSVEDQQYLVKNRLGSVALVLNSMGDVVERLYYSPWGERWDQSGNITKVATASINQIGFTGHEHLDDFGMIHAGGRLYDPHTGFFVSPDPMTQDIYQPQVFNRYSYAFNSPLRFVDPTGLAGFDLGAAFEGFGRIISDPLKWLNKGGVRFNKWVVKPNNQRMLGGMAISIVGAYLAGPVLSLHGTNYMMFSTATGTTASYVASNGDLRATAIGAVQGFAFAGIGEFFDTVYKGDFAKEFRVLAHATAGGAISRAQGGSFESGFVSSGVRTAFFAYGFADSAFDAAKSMEGFERSTYNAVVAGLIEGSISELTGGSFENGALTGAFAQLFNEELHKLRQAIEPYLKFDGMTLDWIGENGKAEKSWPAVSGRENYQHANYMADPNNGPIPEGVWYVDQTQYQNFWDYSLLDKLISPNFGPWKGSIPAWGTERIWLNPAGGTATFDRSGFTIHGGLTPGSAGCIDLTKYNHEFMQSFRSYGKGMPLVVKYWKYP